MINLTLGIIAVLIWGGAFVWYFYDDLRRAWEAYRQRWTR